jgi:hypothetical protein
MTNEELNAWGRSCLSQRSLCLAVPLHLSSRWYGASQKTPYAVDILDDAFLRGMGDRWPG